jgi:hypothetical protein
MRAVVPISLCNPDLWSGWWTVGSRYTDKNGRVVTQTYGNLRFELSSMDEVTIKGMYDFSGKGGTVDAKLNRKCGPTIKGKYSDPKGTGKLEATLQSDGITFEGRYRPTGGSWRLWWGHRT